MKLESLANELLLDLFEYVSTIDLLLAFYNLNNRFNNLVFLYFQTHSFNLQSATKTNFDLICQKYLPSITDRILSLRLSDDDDTPQEIDLFFSHGLSLQQFSHLQSLSIYRLYSLHSLKRIIDELPYLPHLIHLKIIQHTVIYDIGIINVIERLPKLQYCHLDITNDDDYDFRLPSITSLSLKHLSIPHLDCNLNQLICLIKYIPNLQSLNGRIVDNSTISPTLLFSFLSIGKLKFVFYGSLNAMKTLLQTMPNLRELKIELASIYIDGFQWESMIENYLAHLIIFQFKMSTSLSDQKNKEKRIDEILNAFCSQFWIEKHQWFVQCNWISIDKPSIIHVYTLPYAFQNYIYIGNVQSKSTCIDHNQKWSYDRIHHFYYSNFLSENVSLSHIDLRNIRYLNLTMPFDDSFWSIVSTVDRLISLNIILTDNIDLDDIQSKLQILFDRSFHLHSLTFFSWSIGHRFPCALKTLSIRRLDLRGPNIEYNQQQCLELSRSAIGKQCEVLLINVEQRTNIIDLVNNMNDLRALIVRCQENIELRQRREKLVPWLQKYLPSTCAISNSIENNNEIRLWIR